MVEIEVATGILLLESGAARSIGRCGVGAGARPTGTTTADLDHACQLRTVGMYTPAMCVLAIGKQERVYVTIGPGL